MLDELTEMPWDRSEPTVWTGPSGSFAVGSDIGPKRNRNDDRVGVVQFLTKGLPGVHVLIAMDGVGGSARGGEAAAIGVSALIESLAAAAPSSLADILRRAVHHADQEIFSALGGQGLTTASVIVIGVYGDCLGVNVGDSRIYGWSAAGDLAQRSEDDTLANELGRHNIDAGAMLRVRGLEHSLARALGERRPSSQPLELEVIDLSEEHGLLVATDGAWSSGESGVMSGFARAGTSSELVDRLLTMNRWLGGPDNASAIAVRDLRALPGLGTASSANASRVRVWAPYGQTTILSVEKPAPIAAKQSTPRKRAPRKKSKPEASVEVGQPLRFPEPEVGEVGGLERTETSEQP